MRHLAKLLKLVLRALVHNCGFMKPVNFCTIYKTIQKSNPNITEREVLTALIKGAKYGLIFLNRKKQAVIPDEIYQIIRPKGKGLYLLSDSRYPVRWKLNKGGVCKGCQSTRCSCNSDCKCHIMCPFCSTSKSRRDQITGSTQCGCESDIWDYRGIMLWEVIEPRQVDRKEIITADNEPVGQEVGNDTLVGPLVTSPLFLPPPPYPYSPPIILPQTDLKSALRSVGSPRRPRSEKKPIPDEQKDEKYYERRKRNNQAAKKSRDARRLREDHIAIRAGMLEHENAVLRAQVLTLREETQSLRQLLLHHKMSEQPHDIRPIPTHILS